MERQSAVKIAARDLIASLASTRRKFDFEDGSTWILIDGITKYVGNDRFAETRWRNKLLYFNLEDALMVSGALARQMNKDSDHVRFQLRDASNSSRSETYNLPVLCFSAFLFGKSASGSQVRLDRPATQPAPKPAAKPAPKRAAAAINADDQEEELVGEDDGKKTCYVDAPLRFVIYAARFLQNRFPDKLSAELRFFANPAISEADKINKFAAIADVVFGTPQDASKILERFLAKCPALYHENRRGVATALVLGDFYSVARRYRDTSAPSEKIVGAMLHTRMHWSAVTINKKKEVVLHNKDASTTNYPSWNDLAQVGKIAYICQAEKPLLGFSSETIICSKCNKNANDHPYSYVVRRCTAENCKNVLIGECTGMSDMGSALSLSLLGDFASNKIFRCPSCQKHNPLQVLTKPKTTAAPAPDSSSAPAASEQASIASSETPAPSQPSASPDSKKKKKSAKTAPSSDGTTPKSVAQVVKMALGDDYAASQEVAAASAAASKKQLAVKSAPLSEKPGPSKPASPSNNSAAQSESSTSSSASAKTKEASTTTTTSQPHGAVVKALAREEKIATGNNKLLTQQEARDMVTDAISAAERENSQQKFSTSSSVAPKKKRASTTPPPASVPAAGSKTSTGAPADALPTSGNKLPSAEVIRDVVTDKITDSGAQQTARFFLDPLAEEDLETGIEEGLGNVEKFPEELRQNLKRDFQHSWPNVPHPAMIKGSHIASWNLMSKEMQLAEGTLHPQSFLLHFRFLKEMQRMLRISSKEWLDYPLVVIAIRTLMVNAKVRKWQPQTLFRNACALQGALGALPLYTTNVKVQIQIGLEPLWRRVMGKWRLDSNQAQPHNQTVATFDWINAALAAVELNDLRTMAAIILQWYMAARIGDVLNLKWKDIIFKQKEDGSLNARITVSEGKVIRIRGPYTVPTVIPPDHAKLILAFFRMPHLKDAQPSTRLFPTAKDNFSLGVAHSYQQRLIRQALKKAHPQLCTRAIRRGSLQAMADSGVDNETLMIFSGHTEVKTLLRYLNWGRNAGDQANRANQAAAHLAPQETSTQS